MFYRTVAFMKIFTWAQIYTASYKLNVGFLSMAAGEDELLLHQRAQMQLLHGKLSRDAYRWITWKN